MNAIIYIIIIPLVIWLVLSALTVSKKDPLHLGAIGEDQVSAILGTLPEEYHVINNIILLNQHKQITTQIDHVVVSPYGIFVIETKNYQGWIFGSENSNQWKETFRTTGGYFFRNPIKQNWGHIYTLAECLELNKRVFQSIIVFSDTAYLRVESKTPVLHMFQLRDYIMGYSQEIFSQSEVAVIVDHIKTANFAGTETELQHSDSVREYIFGQEELLQQGVCPRCGGTLKLKNGKYGVFYGCSNYPNCRYTHNIIN